MTNMAPLPIMVEILLNGAWTDISTYVYQRDGIQITGGNTTWSSGTPSPAQANLTLNNRDGRFSPNNTSGAYYPNLTRNIQLRISIVNAVSSSGNTYTGYRFWGTVTDWPPQSEETGQDIYCQITANGPLRQINMGGGMGSALARYYQTLTGNYAPIAYWPCEEDPATGTIGAGIDNGSVMNVTTGTPKWKAISDFNGSSPIAVINNSTWDGLTGSFGSSGNDVFSNPGSYPWIASTTTVTAKVWGAGGGGANGGANAGGGGGGYATATIAVTPGTSYTVTVGAGGSGGAGSGGATNGGSNGAASTFTGDSSETATGNGGQGGQAGGTGGTGGTGVLTGITGTTHTGGSGGNFSVSNTGGAGGGSSAGTAANGNNGVSSSGSSGGAGGSAPTGGGAGGNGGHGGTSPSQGNPGQVPGGGGGGGGFNTNTNWNWAGGVGASGQVQLTYTASSIPTTNVIRAIILVPKHGGNAGSILLQAKTGGTIATLNLIYQSGGGYQLQGKNSGGTTLFTSSTLSIANGQTHMVSIELQNSGSSVAWALRAITPGSGSLLGSVTGTQATASCGNVSEVIVAPNHDITKTAMGHISLQYALIGLVHVSKALDGHTNEVGIDRFVRLCAEQAMDNLSIFSETADHWGFESGTQSWVGTNATLTSSTVSVGGIKSTGDMIPDISYWAWPPEGTHSLLITANGVGAITARSPSGTSGQPVVVGDIVTANFDIYTPAAVSGLSANIDWYTSGGASISSSSTALGTPTGVGQIQTVKVKGTAPATAAFFAVSVTSSGTLSNGTLVYLDHVRVQPQMGTQERKLYASFLKDIQTLEQGMMKEAKSLWGLGWRTRISLINQAAAVTLDYSQAMVSPPLQPVLNDSLTNNDVTVQRHKGSKVQVSLTSGTMSTSLPPNGTGRYKKTVKVVANDDAQLIALATHLLNLGTDSTEQYPTITVELARCAIPGHALAPQMSAVAGVDIGDFVKITNLPSWYPATTAKALVIGYQENINTFGQWTITWNTVPESSWEISANSLRRW